MAEEKLAGLSSDMQDLISSMLNRDPAQRAPGT